jgi:hypothetical protein
MKDRVRPSVLDMDLSRERSPYPKSAYLVDEKLFIGVWLVWIETNHSKFANWTGRAPTWMRNASIHPYPVPFHLLAYVYPPGVINDFTFSTCPPNILIYFEDFISKIKYPKRFSNFPSTKILFFEKSFFFFFVLKIPTFLK